MRRHLSYANVAATLALVLSTTGGALAASHYLINSTRQINPKVIRKLRGHTGPRGALGPEGPQGPLGPTGPRGFQGKEGPAGLSDLSALPTGSSLSGVFGMSPDNGAAEGKFAQTVSFGLALKEALPEGHVHYGATEGKEPCPAPGQAERGYLCLYSTGSSGVSEGGPEVLDPEAAPPAKGAGKHGFIVRWTADAPDASDFGTYTATGP